MTSEITNLHELSQLYPKLHQFPHITIAMLIHLSQPELCHRERCSCDHIGKLNLLNHAVELAKLSRFLDPHQGDTLLKKVSSIRKQKKGSKALCSIKLQDGISTTATPTKHVLSSQMATNWKSVSQVSTITSD